MDDSDQIVLSQIVDIELEERSPQEIASSYRAICAMLLVRAAVVTSRPSRWRMLEVHQKRAAQDWIKGGQGVITFEEACEAMDVDPGRARDGMRRHAESRQNGAINKKMIHVRTVFGRTAPYAHDLARKTETRPGVGTSNPVGHSRRIGPTRAG